MLFLSTIDEMKACYSRLNVNTAIESFSSYEEDAVIKYITPLVGPEIIDEMVAWYSIWDGTTTNSTDEWNAKLLKHIQRALTFYILLDAAPSMVLDMGDNGLTEKTSDNTTASRQWTFDRLVEYLSSSADSFAENLLAYLDMNIAEYPIYESSAFRLEAKKLFIDSGKRLNQFVSVTEPRRFYTALIQSITKIENLTIKEMLGVSLFNELKDQLSTNTLSSENLNLVSVIRPVVVYYAIVDALGDMTVSVGATGIKILNASDVQRNRGGDDTQNGIVIKHRNNAVTYEGILRNFINDNAADYPLFQVPTLPTDAGSKFSIPDNTFKKSFRF
jgi:hypothetical protein